MHAIAQVGTGTGVQGAARAAAGQEKPVAGFRDALEQSVDAGKAVAPVTAHVRDKKTEQGNAKAAGSTTAVGKPTDEPVAGAPVPCAQAGEVAVVDANVATPLQVMPMKPATGESVADAAGGKRSESVSRGKVAAPAMKKDATAVPVAVAASTEVKAGSEKGATEKPAPVSGNAGTSFAKEALKQGEVGVAALPGSGPKIESKSSLKLVPETSSAVSAGTAPPEQVHRFAAAPNVLEVGLANTAHGWVRVRAEVGTDGVVSAQVVTASASAAENLRRELPLLSAYLASEQVGVSSLTVNAAEKGAEAAMSFSRGSGSSEDPRRQRRSAGAGFEADEAGSWPVAGRPGFGAVSMMSGGSGGWLSVRV